MKKILFPTDYSASADNAYRYALQVASKTKATIVTLHVFQKPDVGRAKFSSTMRDIYEHNEMDELENSKVDVRHLSEIAEKEGLSDIDTEHILEEGAVIPTILEVADRENVDIIIMGSNGMSNISERLYGSNAAGVLEQAHIFVLTVPQEAVFDGDLNKIAIATSFSDIEKKAMISFLELAKELKSETQIICVNVDRIDESIDEKLAVWKAEFGKYVSKFDIIDSDDVVLALHDYVEENNVDVVAMLTKRRPFLMKWFSKSLTKKMIYFQKLPVLALQEHAIKKV